jgi:hypothetical protein
MNQDLILALVFIAMIVAPTMIGFRPTKGEKDSL